MYLNEKPYYGKVILTTRRQNYIFLYLFDLNAFLLSLFSLRNPRLSNSFIYPLICAILEFCWQSNNQSLNIILENIRICLNEAYLSKDCPILVKNLWIWPLSCPSKSLMGGRKRTGKREGKT